MEMKIVMIDFDGAGKTTILYNLKLGEIVRTIPTIGFNVEIIECRNIYFNIWDIGGQSQIRVLWNHYFQDTKRLIFVVDTHDYLSNAMNITEIRDKLNLHSLSNRKWHIQAACTLDGTGLSKGLDWLSNQLKDN